MDGILNIDKPPGITSARLVQQVKRLLPRGVKIGHAGTLDPFATGVLVLLIGRCTRLCERFMDQPKAYEATIKLGATTATDDPESPEEPFAPAPGVIIPLSHDRIESILPQFVGVIQQRPPSYSAMKIGGRRAYQLARQGQAVPLEPRRVRIDGIDLLDYAWPLVRVRIACGRGTYIRSLARDIGAALGTGGHLTELRRTRIGPLTGDRGVTLDQLRHDGVQAHLLDPASILDLT